MRTLEQLERDKKRSRPLPNPEEEMEEELERPQFVPLNQTKSIFDDGPGRTFSGINTAPSVFARQAAIHTED